MDVSRRIRYIVVVAALAAAAMMSTTAFSSIGVLNPTAYVEKDGHTVSVEGVGDDTARFYISFRDNDRARFCDVASVSNHVATAPNCVITARILAANPVVVPIRADGSPSALDLSDPIELVKRQ